MQPCHVLTPIAQSSRLKVRSATNSSCPPCVVGERAGKFQQALFILAYRSLLLLQTQVSCHNGVTPVRGSSRCLATHLSDAPNTTEVDSDGTAAAPLDGAASKPKSGDQQPSSSATDVRTNAYDLPFTISAPKRTWVGCRGDSIGVITRNEDGSVAITSVGVQKPSQYPLSCACICKWEQRGKTAPLGTALPWA